MSFVTPEVYFTSDTHFGHKNVIGYCSRPWKTVEEMDEALIENWNSVVKPHDCVYHLGDFAFAKRPRIKEIVAQLNGHKVLILGNHDLNRKEDFWREAGFEVVHKLGYGKSLPYQLSIDYVKGSRVPFYMCHYPLKHAMGDYDKRDYLVPHAPEDDERNKPLVHGHVHEQWRLRPNMVNVGVDVWNYKPVSLSKVIECTEFVSKLPDGWKEKSVV